MALEVISNNGCKDTVYKKLRIIEDWNLYVPNAFTPNNDGVNDVFQPKGYNIKTYKLLIFNRWGQCVFSTSAFEHGWDGSFKNSSSIGSQDDVYTWKINVTNGFNKAFELTGSVMLLK